MNTATPLPTFRLVDAAAIAQASPWHSEPVGPDSPALEVMTDLTRVKAATIAPDQTLRQAEQAMIYLGVRMLFVVDHMPTLEGLITSHDVRGERPMRVVHERLVAFDEISVADVMTPLLRIEVVEYARMASATVRHVIATLQRYGRDHLLVAEPGDGGAPPWQVRGVVSRAQVERQLGQPIVVTDIANGLSEIERALTIF
jgi:CBS domain-containing protein